MPGTDQTVRLTDVVRALARRWRVVLGTVLVAVSVATVAGLVLPQTYTATAVVTVSPITLDPFGSSSPNQQINIETEQQVVVSGDVAASAATTLDDGRNGRELRRNVEVTSPGSSLVLQIAFTDRSPQGAADGANAFASAYLDARVATANAVANRMIEDIDTRIEDLTAQIDEFDSGQVSGAIQELIIELRQQQSDLVTVALNPGQIVGEATTPESPSSLGLPVFLVAGLALGLLAGLALALLRDRADPRVSDAARLAELVEAPVVDASSVDDLGEPYRLALLTLGLTGRAAATAPHPVVLVVLHVSPKPSRRRETDLSAAAADLAIAAVAHGKRTRLIAGHGLGTTALDQGWPRPEDRVDWVGDDLVVIDASSVASVTRKAALASRAGQVVLAVAPSTGTKDVRELRTVLGAADADVDLAVLFPGRHHTVTLPEGLDVVDTSAGTAPPSSTNDNLTVELTPGSSRPADVHSEPDGSLSIVPLSARTAGRRQRVAPTHRGAGQ